MERRTKDELAGALANASAEFAREQKRLQRELEDARVQLAAATGRERELGRENQQLREDVHRLELEVAELRGYRARVQEFDPVSERQIYADQTMPRRAPPDPGPAWARGVANGERVRRAWYDRAG